MKQFNNNMKLSTKSIILLITLVLIANITCKKEVNKPPYHPVAIYPEHNAVINHIPEKLSWYCNDPEQDIVVCDLYFGENNPPELLASELNVFEFSDITIESQKTYFWKIVGTDTFNNTTEGDVWIFTVGNLPPETPANPIPENNSVDQPATTLSWECIEAEGETLTYNIYFGTMDTPELLEQDFTENTYQLHELTGSQKYYWRIIAKDSYGNEITGPLWNFATDFFAPKLFFPEENALNAPWYPKLQWSCENAEDLTYDVYIGTSNTPELLVSDLTDTSYHQLEQLVKEQTYYWKVIAKNTGGETSESTTGLFTVFGDPVFNSFTDARDGNTYQTVTIGKQTWMAENLKYNVAGSKVYDDDPLNEDIYGRLYNWEQIMNGEEESNENPSDVQGIAPEGWHIPSDSEWFELLYFLGGQGNEGAVSVIYNVAEKLTEEGIEHWYSANGTNESGFTALGAGEFDIFNGYGYSNLTRMTVFHCCSETDLRYQIDNGSSLLRFHRQNYSSLRCVKN